MAKKKKQKNKIDKKSTVAKIVLGLLFIAFGLLLFFSLISFSNDDIVTLQNSNLDIYKILTLQFPAYLSNMIGPFGAFLSYGFIYLFSKLFSLILAAYLIVSGFIALFSKKLKNLSHKILNLLLMITFANLFYVAVGGNFFLSRGIPSGTVFRLLIIKVFEPIFSSLGSAIIFGVAFVGCLMFLIGLDNLLNFFKTIFQKKKKKKQKPRKSRKSRKPTISHLEEKKKGSKASEKIKDKDTQIDEPKKVSAGEKVFTKSNSDNYIFPDCKKILKSSTHLTQKQIAQKKDLIGQNSEILISKLNEFGVEGEVTNVNVGPIITQYEVRPAPGVKISKITNLANDLALAMKAKKIRIVAPIPGKNTLGFEIPNESSNLIRLRDVLNSEEMQKSKSPTMVALGKGITGKPFVADLKNLRHLLIAGLTGSGKSVCLNAIITSILCRTKPEQLRFILFDPKKIELSVYKDIPHLIKEVITDPKDVLYLLRWAVNEMDRRYEVFSEHHVRNISDYHQMLEEKNQDDETEEDELDKLPFIIIVVDELADLMQSLAKDIEKPLRRLSGMARAVGIYLVFATQRPSVDVVNGMIKANFPSRISFQVYSKTDSRTVLDVNGAETLLGAGDMLFSPLGKKPPIRIHGSYISTKEVKKVVKHLAKYEQPELDISLPSDKKEQLNVDYDDELFPEAVKIVVKKQYASVSMLQRRFHIGYARAGRLVNQMEDAGIVGGSEGSKPRKVLVQKSELTKLGF